MATRLNRPVKRRVESTRVPMIITLYPNGTMGLREHRRRKEFVVPVGKVFRLAVDVTIEAERKAKAAERDRKRAERGLPPIRRLVKRGLL